MKFRSSAFFLSSLRGPTVQTAIKSYFRMERPNNASPLREQINFSFPFPCFPWESPLIEEWDVSKGCLKDNLYKKKKKEKRKKTVSFHLFLLREEFFRVVRLVEVTFSTRL